MVDFGKSDKTRKISEKVHKPKILTTVAQSAGAIKYTDYFSAEG